MQQGQQPTVIKKNHGSRTQMGNTGPTSALVHRYNSFIGCGVACKASTVEAEAGKLGVKDQRELLSDS